MATVVEIADAVVAALNAAALSLPLAAERSYLPEFDLGQMKDLHVTVVPAELDEELLDRTRDAAQYKIHLAVQKRVSKAGGGGLDSQAIDALMHLVEEIDDLFRHKPLAGYPQAHWVKTENRPIYDPKHLKEHSQFTSLLILTFQVAR